MYIFICICYEYMNKLGLLSKVEIVSEPFKWEKVFSVWIKGGVKLHEIEELFLWVSHSYWVPKCE